MNNTMESRAVSAARVCAVAIAGVAAGPIWAGGPTGFTEEALARGVIFEMDQYPMQWGVHGFGCGFADLDGDGDPDIVLLGGENGELGLFENDGTGQFTDRSVSAGDFQFDMGSGFAAGDYDADGDLDLFVSQIGLPNLLLRNNGDWTFTDVAPAAGVDGLGASKSGAWGDFNSDGWLDLYVPNYANLVVPNLPNFLYVNNGDGTFTDVAAAQTVDDIGYGFQAAWFDYDRDGDVDLYLSNDRGHLPPLFQTNQLWRNDDGQMTNVSVESGTNVAIFSMGVACGDFDGNGWPDLYCTNIAVDPTPQNPLLLNQGDGTFLEQSDLMGVANYITSWGSIFFDYNNDGGMDLYVNNMFEPNTMFDSGLGFPCVELAGPLGVQGNDGVSYSSAVADIDGDGDLDLLVNNLDENVELFVNHDGDAGAHLRFNFVGDGPNTWAVGGSIDALVDGKQHFREVLTGTNGYLGQNELTLHVGAGEANVADEVVVQWPGFGPARTLTNVPVNQTWTLYPPARLGDADGDGDVDLDDFGVFAPCYGGAITPGCEMMDFDGDSDVDEDDYQAFLDRYPAILTDCNGDGLVDLPQILANPRLDADQDGVLDVCAGLIVGDLNADFTVDGLDVAAVLDLWGACPARGGCAGDLNADGVVNAIDLAIVLANF